MQRQCNANASVVLSQFVTINSKTAKRYIMDISFVASAINAVEIYLCACKRMQNLKAFAFQRHIPTARFIRRTGFLFSAGILNKQFEGLHMSPHKSRYNYLLKPPEDYLPVRVLCLEGGWVFVVGGIAEQLNEKRRERGIRTGEDSEY